MNFSIVHDFDCDVGRYWSIFFDETYNEALYRQLDVKERVLLEKREEAGGETIVRVIRVVPKAELPAILKRAVSGEISYIERSTFQRSKNTVDVRVEIDVPAVRDRFDMGGVYTVTPLGDQQVRREFRGIVRVGIPFIGGQVEEKVISGIRRNYEVTTTFTRRWIAEHASAVG